MALLGRLTAPEYLRFVGRMYGLERETVNRRTEELLEFMQLADERRKLVTDFSHGMQKKLALAAAVIHGPRVLFLDEPFEGVDAIAAGMLKTMLQGMINRGATIFLTTHVLEIVERLCSHVAIIHQGRLVANGSIEELRAGVASTLPGAETRAAPDAGRDFSLDRGGGRARTGAGAFMAGVAQAKNATIGPGGPFGHMARRQYAALVAMRWRMVANSVRSVQGAFEFGARGVAFIIYSIMGLSLGFGLGAGAFSMVSSGHLQLLSALFWTVLLVWQVLPIALASFQEQFDLSGLLRFPVNFGSFYLLNVVFGLVDVPTILGGICSLGILAGVTLARPGLFLWTALVLAVYALFNILLARTVLAWVDRWLAKRRSREVVSAIFLLLMLSLQLLNPALHQQNRSWDGKHRVRHPSGGVEINGLPEWAKSAVAVGPWLPPGLAAEGIYQNAIQKAPFALESMGVLGLYILATGALLSVRLRAEFRGERLSDAPAARKRNESDSRWLLDGSGPIAAVMEKELRTIPRSMPLLFAIGAPLLTVLVISTMFRNGALGGRPFQLAFPLCVCYALLGFTQMIFNNLGAEGTGIQMLFLSPTPIRTVLLAKNLLHGMLYALVAFLAGAMAAFDWARRT